MRPSIRLSTGSAANHDFCGAHFFRGDLRGALGKIAALMEQNRERLCRLDSELGDGDLGLTMTKGFKTASAELDAMPTDDMGRQLECVADSLADSVASTMGTLLAAGFFAAAQSCRGKPALNTTEMAAVAQDLAAGIARRGKAKLGDKTILEAIMPAAQALTEAAAAGATVAAALRAAAAAAERGAVDSAALQSRLGRAARYLERSKGRQDAGAVAGALIFAGLAAA